MRPVGKFFRHSEKTRKKEERKKKEIRKRERKRERKKREEECDRFTNSIDNVC